MKFDDNSRMPFGKYKGWALCEVPDEYLLWLYESDLQEGPLKRYIRENLDAIQANVNRKTQ